MKNKKQCKFALIAILIQLALIWALDEDNRIIQSGENRKNIKRLGFLKPPLLQFTVYSLYALVIFENLYFLHFFEFLRFG